jgi:EAL domain-containing protein (putative c-di-GMP-specific phosphodiesterase class I)
MSDPVRLLGFAFANADFLFEVDRDGTVVFATGAASDFMSEGSDTLVGRGAGRLFQPSEAVKFSTFSRALGKGDRAGPFRLKLAGGTDATVSMFRLPQNGDRISCTLAKPGLRTSFVSKEADPKTGLPTRDTFLSAAAKMATDSDALTLVEVPGLTELCAKLPPAGADKLLEGIGAAIKATGAKTAGRLSDTSFGAIADAATGNASLIATIRGAMAKSGLPSTRVEETLISLKGQNLSGDQRMLAVRYVVERFANGQHIQNCGSDLGTTFAAMLDETQERVRALSQTVANGAFTFAFQPIVDLNNGTTSHFEALARFAPANTGETVQFVEALGIADALDFSVAMKVIAALEGEVPAEARIAFNISGHTISSPVSFGLLAGFLARKHSLAPRLLIEITETAEIVDLAGANQAVASLRAMGFRVGLDDFGAGAASLNYLHALSVDFVKFDGALVKKMGASKRDDMLLNGMIKLCKELGVLTIAECLESEEQVSRAKAFGFDMGQGFFLGKPLDKIPPAPRGAAKRKGITESWG